MDDDSLLDALARDILTLRDKLAHAERRFQEEAAGLCDVKVGQIVERRGGQYLVTKITFDRPWSDRVLPMRYIVAVIRAAKIKKDGTPTSRSQILATHRISLGG